MSDKNKILIRYIVIMQDNTKLFHDNQFKFKTLLS